MNVFPDVRLDLEAGSFRRQGNRENGLFLYRRFTVRGPIAAHGAHHVAQITEFQEKDYAHEAETWQVMRRHVYVIAGALTTALVKQFPEQVCLKS